MKKILVIFLLAQISLCLASTNYAPEDILKRMSELAPKLEVKKAMLWSKTIYEECRKYNLDPYIMLAIIRQESNFNEKAVSHKNALGLTQILFSWWKNNKKFQEAFPGIVRSDLFNGVISIKISAWILNDIYQTRKDEIIVLPPWVHYYDDDLTHQVDYWQKVSRFIPPKKVDLSMDLPEDPNKKEIK